jgi:hypothetical protein
LATGTVTLNDGLKDYEAAEAIRVLFQLTTLSPETYDGKVITHPSPRPLNPKTYTYWTGRGDSLVQRAAGDLLAFDVKADTPTMTIEVPFHYGPMNYLRQAFIGYENAGWLNSVSASLVAGYTPIVEGGPQPIYKVVNHIIHLDISGGGTHSLAGYPVPVPAYPFNGSVGYWNINPDFTPAWVPDGTGTYNFYDIDIPVGTFMQDFLIYGTNFHPITLDSNDIENVPPGYMLTVTVNNRAGVDFKVWANLYEYKQSII